MQNRLFLGFFMTLLLFSCATAGKKSDAPVGPGDSAAVFFKEGKKLLELPAKNRFFKLLNQYGDKYTDETENLLLMYAEKEQMLVSYYKGKNDLFQMVFHFNNLNSASTLSPSSVRRFYRDLITRLRSGGYESTARYYSIEQKLSGITGNNGVPISSILDYEKILAEVDVDFSYKSKLDFVRKDATLGSGFLISPTNVLTAYHVVEDVFDKNTLKYDIHVKIGDRSFDNVKVTAWDSLTDIAILRLPESVPLAYDVLGLLGDSTGLRQGDEVYCLGHHSGYTSTLTKGIISATYRKAPEVGSWLQVDANITGGASGGLLIGKDLRIYGMIVAGILYEDINFIVPSQTILEVVDRLMHNISINRPWLGLLLHEDRYRKANVTIMDIFPSSPLHGLGVEAEDVLYEINGQKIDTIDHAQKIINSLQAGNLVRLVIKNKKQQLKSLWVLLERRPEYAVYNATVHFNRISSLYPYFGFRIDENSSFKRGVNILGKNLAIVFYKVTQVEKDTFMDYMGVKPGDHIGFIDDYFKNKTRYIEVIHIPQSININAIDNIFDFIYRMRKDKYDENIL